MHVLILSSRCTEEQRNALTVLRGCLEAHGDVCEALDWFSFLADSVSQINAHSRKLVRRHVQELLTEGFSALSKSEAEAPEKGRPSKAGQSMREGARSLHPGRGI